MVFDEHARQKSVNDLALPFPVVSDRVKSISGWQSLMADTLSAQLTVSSLKLHSIVLHMCSEFKKGLASENESIKMFPSHVVTLPTGNEVGHVLALDMGGSNFRVLLVYLEGGGRVRTKQRKFALTDEYKKVSGRKLFDFFADCVASFIKDENIGEGPLNLGFTFSFPVKQTSINRGTLVSWVKGFENSGVEGKDVVLLLEESLKRKGLKIKVTALVNDTVGTLVTHAYKDPQTYVSVILGTGSNAAYVEKASEIPKWPSNDGIVVINTEWGAYGDTAILPITDYDRVLDRASENPKRQIFEKMISGLYLGELARFIILDLVSSGDLFKGEKSALFDEPHSFATAYMSRIERDHSLDLIDTKSVLEDVMGIQSTCLNDRRIVKHMCELVGTRAARLAAAGIAALVTKINRLDACTVAIDGSLYEHYPHFGNRMRDALRELLGITAENIILEQARDGSGQGAALIAALHSQ
jgi:hexokinase